MARYQYALIRYVVDSMLQQSTPFGLIYWKEGQGPADFEIRAPRAEETVSNVGADHRIFFPRFVERFRSYVTQRQLPYAGEVDPTSSGFWSHLASLEPHRFRIEGPQTVETSEIGVTDMELLFQTLVRPKVPVDVREQRIDSMLNAAMGPLRETFESKANIRGLENRELTFLKVYRFMGREVLIDAVNLAEEEGERDFEALLWRVIEALETAKTERRLLLGYFAAPDGLNGEAPLVRRGSKLSGNPMFNLVTEQAEFRKAVEKLLT